MANYSAEIIGFQQGMFWTPTFMDALKIRYDALLTKAWLLLSMLVPSAAQFNSLLFRL